MRESPFLTERARGRAPVAMSVAAAVGAALFVSPRGDIVLSEGDLPELASRRIVRRARECRQTFRDGDACVYVIAVARGWQLVAVSHFPIAPPVVIERLERAARVLALALADRPPTDQGHGPAGAEVQAVPRSRVRSRPPERRPRGVS